MNRISLIKKTGCEFLFPKGPSKLIDLINSLFIALRDSFDVYKFLDCVLLEL